jgi:hypothetical protein
MSAWLSVYCRASVAAITAADLVRALDLPDPCLEAEVYGIEDEVSISAAMGATSSSLIIDEGMPS